MYSKKLYQRCLVCSVFILLSLQASCGNSGECVNGVQLSDYNTSGLQCTKPCDCSNLKYEGYCISGVCVSNPRNPAQRKGEVRSCKLLQKVGSCEEGIQEAQSTPLKELVWGDCLPPKIVAENTVALCADGKDNDCNGMVDDKDPGCSGYCVEGRTEPCYGTDRTTLNQGNCRAGLKTCEKGGVWGACTGEIAPKTEVCNNQDDDCNGLIDDGLSGCGTTEKCIEGSQKPCYTEPKGCVLESLAGGAKGFRCLGGCKTGIQECLGGTWGACQGEVKPVEESCDGLDNNCDGQVDEGCSCSAGAERECFLGSQKQAVGECLAGKQRCEGGTWGTCADAVGPQVELCDGKDNDCDGAVDNNATCPDGQSCTQGSCKPKPSEEIPNEPLEEATPEVVADAGNERLPEIYPEPSPETASCNPNETLCGSVCVNLQIDSNHCGGCGKGCLANQRCSGGACTDKGIEVVTVAGTPPFRDGLGNIVSFQDPYGIVFDGAAHFYIADTSNHRIRKMDLNGNVVTVAGRGDSGFLDGQAMQAKLNGPKGLSWYKGALYIADEGNGAIRKLDSQGNVSTVANNLLRVTSLVLDGSGKIYAAGGNRVWKVDESNGKVEVIAGSATKGFSDGPAMQALFDGLSGVALDASGNLYISDSGNNRVRKIDTQGAVSTIAGNGSCTFQPSQIVDGDATQSYLCRPKGLAFDSMGNLFVVDEGHSRVRKLNPQGIITTFAGTGGAGVVGTLDGAASSAKFWYPSDLSLDSLGNLYVVDAGGHRVRKIDTQNNVTTLAGNGPSYGYKDGAAIQALFKNPRGIASDSLGNLYVVDKGNYKLRVVDARRMVSSVAGSTWGYTDGNSNQAKFRDVGPSTIDTLGNVYLSDSGIIRKVDKNGTVTTVSGDYGSGPGYLDGPALQARFSVSIYGLAFNNKGELYIADSGNYRLRKLDLSANVVTVAGVGAGGYKDGPAMQAEFKSIRGLVFDSSGNLYIADSGNFRIRKLDLLGNVTTVAGSSRGYKDGAAAQALFEFIDVLVFDSLGNLYISEGKRIRKLDINGDVTTVVGGASVGFRDGFLEEALFLEISGMVFGTDGLLYVTDKHVVRCVR